jgi:hypothetical protein
VEEFLTFFFDGGIGIVQELSERCIFTGALGGTIEVEGLGEEVNFAIGLRNGRFVGNSGALLRGMVVKGGERVKGKLPVCPILPNHATTQLDFGGTPVDVMPFLRIISL